MGLLGVGLVAIRLSKNIDLRFRMPDLFVCLLMAGVSIMSVVAVIVNGTSDFTFVKYPISMVLITFGAYFVMRVIAFRNKTALVMSLLDTFIAAIVAQNVIAVLMFAVPALMDLANSIQSISNLEQGLLGEVEGVRIVGFGSKFFEAGVVNGFGLIAISYRLASFKCSAWRQNLLSISFIALFLIGIMMARTTMVGFLLALLLFVLSNKTQAIAVNRRTFYAYLIVVPIVLYAIYSVFLAESDLKALVEFGFEIFFNMSENGKVESKSTNQLLDMYGVVDSLPLALGDGYFGDPLYPEAYYKAVDVGYLRLILYFGVPGMIVYFMFQLYCICYSLIQSRASYQFIAALAVYLLLLNMKGFVDFYYFVIPFLFASRFDAALYGNARSMKISP
jgi:hypothetical protein